MSTETSAKSPSDEAVNPNLNILVCIGAGNYSAEHDLSLAQHSPVDITPCSIGLLGLSKCSSTKILKRGLDVDKQKLLKIRTGVLSLKNNNFSIHFEEYLENFSNKQQRSCGVRLKCSGSRTQDLCPINYSDYVKSRQFGCGQFLLVPGQVMCLGCRLYCHKIVQEEIERRKREKEIMEPEGKHYLEPEDPGSPDISDCENESTSADNSESASTSQSAGTSQSHPYKRVHSDEDFSTPSEIAREKLNNALMLFGKSPVDSRKFVKSKKYAAEKTEELQASVSGSVQKVAGEVTVKDSELVKEYMEMLSQLKEKFNLPETTLTEKFIILSILPPSWTLQRMTDFFQCLRYMARVVKDKVALQGILCSPNPRPGRRLDEETVKKVILFYKDDRHSRLLPGKRDFKTVKIDGERVQIQKRLLLLTVGELYEVFKEECPTFKVSISKFAKLRPLYVVLAGAAGTHSVRVCTIHQNVKFDTYNAKTRNSKALGKTDVVVNPVSKHTYF